jgi:hypothetical protein
VSKSEKAYALALFDALFDDREADRFRLGEGGLGVDENGEGGDPAWFISCDKKPVLLVLTPKTLKLLGELTAIRDAIEQEGEEQDEDAEGGDEEESPRPRKTKKSSSFRP